VKRVGRQRILPWIYGASLAVHLSFLLVATRIPTPEPAKTFAIELADIKKKDPPKLPPPPAALKAETLKALTHVPASHALPKAAEARTVEALTPANAEPLSPAAAMLGADGFADLGGIALGNGPGGSLTGAAATPSATRPANAPKAVAHRVEQLAPPVEGGCTEPVVKPKTKRPGQVTYTKEAQEAEIEGAVRVQVTVDESGKVINASVVSGLGYGLDERALAAARETLFEPATLCGKPVVGMKILAFNFGLR
jgi:protein TonB